MRRAEHARLRKEGDERLKGTKYIWLRGTRRRKREDLIAIRELMRSGLKVGRAWALKEAIRKLWDYTYLGPALKYFRRWYAWAVRSQLPPMICLRNCRSGGMAPLRFPWPRLKPGSFHSPFVPVGW